MSKNRVSGTFHVKIGGEVQSAKGAFTFGGGNMKREAQLAEDGNVVGYNEKPQVPFIEGQIYDLAGLDTEALKELDGVDVSVHLANSKVVALSDAWYAHEGNQSTEDGTVPIRFEGKHIDLITS